jgi:hypothetical protein
MNSLAIAISIILLPGLVACVICDKITVHSPKWDAFKYSRGCQQCQVYILHKRQFFDTIE